jgi:hypothetical protein
MRRTFVPTDMSVAELRETGIERMDRTGIDYFLRSTGVAVFRFRIEERSGPRRTGLPPSLADTDGGTDGERRPGKGE